MRGVVVVDGKPLTSHSRPLENGAAFPEKTASRALDEDARFWQISVIGTAKKDTTGSNRRPSGSDHSKSGSICGHERIAHPWKSRINALRSGQTSAKTRFYQGKLCRLTHLERSLICQNLFPTVQNRTMKQWARCTSGSDHSKSGSICGHERIGDPIESRSNALRSGQITAKTRFYHVKTAHLNRADAVQITVKHRGQTFASSRAMPARAKTGSILRLSSILVLANKTLTSTICKYGMDFWRLSRLMTHVEPNFGSHTSSFWFDLGEK